jgi:hypothetical protein
MEMRTGIGTAIGTEPYQIALISDNPNLSRSQISINQSPRHQFVLALGPFTISLSIPNTLLEISCSMLQSQ